MTVIDQILALLATLQNDVPDAGVSELLNFVIIDSKRGTYNIKPDRRKTLNLKGDNYGKTKSKHKKKNADFRSNRPFA